MIIEPAPQSYSKEYQDRQSQAISSAIEQVNEVGIRASLPDRPKAGKIYFIPPEGDETGQFWVYLDDWYTIDLTKATQTTGNLDGI